MFLASPIFRLLIGEISMNEIFSSTLASEVEIPRIAVERLTQALQDCQKKLKNLDILQRSYDELDKLLQDLPLRRIHDIMVPFGSVAFFAGQIRRTNEVTVLLGENYFIKCTTSHARTIIQRRKQYLKEDIDKMLKEIDVLKIKLNFASSVWNASLQHLTDGIVEIREEYHSDDEQSKVTEKISSEVVSGDVTTNQNLEMNKSEAKILSTNDAEDENIRMMDKLIEEEEKFLTQQQLDENAEAKQHVTEMKNVRVSPRPKFKSDTKLFEVKEHDIATADVQNPRRSNGNENVSAESHQKSFRISKSSSSQDSTLQDRKPPSKFKQERLFKQ
jgi:prefoldin alpha subunit